MLETANILTSLNRLNTLIQCKLHSIDSRRHTLIRLCTAVLLAHVDVLNTFHRFANMQIRREEIAPLQINFGVRILVAGVSLSVLRIENITHQILAPSTIPM